MQTRHRCILTALLLVPLLALVSAAGAGGPLGGERFLIENQDGVGELEPAAAYNSGRGEYLVVWRGNGVWGRRLSWGGTPLGPAFQVSTDTPGPYPDVAYHSAAGEYLVVWQADADVRGRRVSAEGALLGSVIPIAPGYLPPPGVSGSYYEQPVVAYAATAERYLVVYRYRRDIDNGTSILARSYLSDGTPEAGPFEIAPYHTARRPEQPAVAYNRSRNELLVAWQAFITTDMDVYGRLVKMTGGAGVLGDPFPVAFMLNDHEINPAVAAVPTLPGQGQYLVAWQRGEDVLARPVSWEGTVGAQHVLAGTPWGEYRPAAAGSESSDRFLVAWTWIPVVTPPAMMQVQARAVALDGTLLGETVLVGGGQVYDAAVVAGPRGDVLIAFDDNEVFGTASRGIYGRLWGERTYIPLLIR